eukprot:354038-Chlamydomonas_euryale.AAC.3
MPSPGASADTACTLIPRLTWRLAASASPTFMAPCPSTLRSRSTLRLRQSRPPSITTSRCCSALSATARTVEAEFNTGTVW